MTPNSSSLLRKILTVIVTIIALTACFVLVFWLLNWIFEGSTTFDPTTILQGFIFSIIYLPVQHWLSKRAQKKK